MRLLKVATCNLNQWAMDFESNLQHIKKSILKAKSEGAALRVGSELEITGYGCEDHFLEPDTTNHAWECLRDILAEDLTEGILCSIGMPVEQDGVRYNCQVFCLNQKILLIRPKLCLANDGNYRELRWFSSWKHHRQLVQYNLPDNIADAISQKTVPFGDGYLSFLDVKIAAETCEELFTPDSPHIGLALSGIEVFTNGSGSHHQLRKLNTRLELIQSATCKSGGVYIYSNQQGCDGGRLYYGSTMFLKSIDASSHVKNAKFLCETIEEVIREVGEDNVVQVVTDNAANYVAAGKLLMERHPKIFWTPCAAHCIDLMLEDIGKLVWVKSVVTQAKNLCKFIYNHALVLSTMRQYTKGKELARPGITRFASNFITLKSLLTSRIELRCMFVGPEWSSSSFANSPAGIDATKCIYDDEGFWEPCSKIVEITEPLVSLLRVADGEKPSMGYIYEGMDRVKEAIKAKYVGVEQNYGPIWDIIDRRWQNQLHKPIHAAAYYLNPAYRFRDDFKADEEVLSGLYTVISKMSPNPTDILLEMDAYNNASGAIFSSPICKEGRTKLQPDGCSCIAVNGDIVAQGSQFSLNDIEVLTAVVDLDSVLGYRGAVSSLREQASYKPSFPSIQVDLKLCEPKENLRVFPSLPVKIRYHSPEEEIALGPACWLWDYLRRSGASGYLLPLSGGADSSAVAAIVGCMCQLVTKGIADGDQQVKSDAIRIGQYKKGDIPTDSKEFAKRIFYTVYMGSENSSETTRERANKLSNEIGSWHLDVKIDTVVSSLISLFQSFTGKTPRYKVDGGTNPENLALQNIQARVRMVIAFLFASLMPWVQSKSGFFLVLGSSNVDEGLRGYLTKYDSSSADINPIGSVSKQDLRLFLRWAAVNLGYSSLAEIEAAPPTAELEPIRSNYSQLDEADMGMTYEELSMYGRLRKIFRCGPVSMFQHLCHRWCGRLTPAEVAEKVKYFFRYYSLNRHKMTTLTPSYHAESYSPEDNRFDLRQFLYNTRWPWQFRKIDELVEQDQVINGPYTTCDGPTQVEIASAHGSGMGVPAANSANPSAGI